MDYRTTIRLSEHERNILLEIQQAQNLTSMSAAVRFVLENHKATSAEQMTERNINTQLDVLKKYLNELRRNNFIVLELLNAICINAEISYVPPHNVANQQSTAYISAKEHLNEFMKDVLHNQKRM